MKKPYFAWLLVLAVVVTIPNAFSAEPTETVYEGTWLTTNRRLDGRMTSVVTDLGGNKWRGHFYGIWQGVSFSYKVDFSGPPEKLVGTAVIDGADYRWTGEMNREAPGSFKGSFDGSRYRGSFDLKQKVPTRTFEK